MAGAQPDMNWEEEHRQTSDHAHTENGVPAMTLVTDRYGFLGGNQYTNPEDDKRLPPEVLRKREIKWLDMFENWEKWMSKRFKKVV